MAAGRLVMVRRFRDRWVGMGLLLWVLGSGRSAIAQVVGDLTLPDNERSQVTGNPLFQIDGGATRGTNLFHSFSQFALTNGQTAFFNNAPTITNIISRVTGGVRSEIDGVIRANGTANVFFMNPSGIVFGPNARLQVGGSFLATTAEALQFGEQGFFSAIQPTAPALLTVNPSALWFNQTPIQPLLHRSNIALPGLFVPEGRSLLLVGGDVGLDGGQLSTLGGRVELGGLSAPGVVQLELQGTEWQLRYPANASLADVALANRSYIDVRGRGGGSIALNARNLTIAGNSVVWAGIYPNVGTPESRVGPVVLNATDAIAITNSSSIRNDIGPNGVGTSGDILISARTLSVLNGSQLSTATFGRGDAGDVVIQTRDGVTFDASDVFVNVSRTSTAIGVGQGGDVRITAGSLALTRGSSFIANTRGVGNAGNVLIEVQDGVWLDGVSPNQDFVTQIATTVREDGAGQGGDIRIKAGFLALTNGAQLATTTRNWGDAGDVVLEVRDRVLISGFAKITQGVFNSGVFSNVGSEVYRNATGTGGDIYIAARAVVLEQGGQLASASVAQGKAGAIWVRASDRVSVSGFNPLSGESSAIFSATIAPQQAGGDIVVETRQAHVADGAVIDARTLGNAPGGNLTLTVHELALLKGGQLITSTEGTGPAGKITVNARDRVVVSGSDPTFAQRPGADLAFAFPLSANSGLFGRSSGQFVATGQAGQAGDIAITSDRFVLQDHALVTTETLANGLAGNFTLVANQAEVRNQAKIRTTTAGSQAAGDMALYVRDTLTLSGTDTGLFANTEPSSTGDGGNIFIDPRLVIIENGAEITVGSQGQGRGGDILIVADRLVLNKQGQISAETASNQGGNITLQLRDYLLLRRNSSISTTAGTAQAGGDGGNITINAPDGFIVAVLNENSDIRANAFTGKGGNIAIAARGIYGLQFQTAATPQSDITASSQFGLNGTVILNTPDVDPSRGTVELPTGLVDASALIAHSCVVQQRADQGRFVVTGTGGLPPLPEELAIAPFATYELRLRPEQAATAAPLGTLPTPVEIDGIYALANGEQVLSWQCR